MSFPMRMLRRSFWVCIAFAVGACGDNLTVRPDAGPAGATLEFTPCSPAPLECATLVVPADWSRPGGDTISLPVVRAKARNAAQRLGVITFNYGGPGEATLDSIAHRYPGQPIASTIPLADRFDFVLMDWRGVATTTPELHCLTPQLAARLDAEHFGPVSDGDWDQLFSLVTDINASCAATTTNTPLLAHQDSESAARDFDALRAGLGEDKLNMWVVSYGTRLGMMYAELFPEHVRAIVLDSPMAPTLDFKTFITAQDAAFEAELARFFAWCDRTPACAFHGSSATAYEQLLTTADAAPVVAGGVTLDRAAINLFATNMLYFPPREWGALGSALAALAAGDGTQAAQLVEDSSFASDDNSFASYENIIVQDVPLPADLATPAAYRAWTESSVAAAPHLARLNATLQAFAVGWPGSSPAEHAIGATTAPPLLITATRNDPATPYADAAAVQQALANGSYVVTYEGDGHANAQSDQCLGDATTAFLIDPTIAPATTDCPEIDPTGMARSPVRHHRRL
jgi:pimeloyl-ACP methyl ester carboxylesterase